MLDIPITLLTDTREPMQVGDDVMAHAIDAVPHNVMLEQIVDVICARVSNHDRAFFRMVALYFFAKMAASMHASIKSKDRGNIPVNVYAVALATSGFGKGHSIHILEQDFMSPFKKRFMEDTFPTISEKTLYDLACDRALISGADPTEEHQKIQKEFKSKGALLFSFDSATTAAIKQMRQKTLMAGCGALNLEIDEIGSNLLGSSESLIPYLELYDQGELGNSLRMSGTDNVRGEELDGKTPANALFFGTPATLFDSHVVEAAFVSILGAGMARRCAFAMGMDQHLGTVATSAKEKYLKRIQPQNILTVQTFAQHFALLADPRRFNWEIEVPDDIGLELTIYENVNQERARRLMMHETLQEIELQHRHFKALKIAGALAFVDESDEITMDHLYQAIKIVEDSGVAFKRMLTREKNYVRLAKFIADKGGELTNPEIFEALPFYKEGNRARDEMMGMARDWGYRNHIIIRKLFKEEGVTVFTGEKLQETDLNKIMFSWSDHPAYEYNSEVGPFDQLHNLTQADGLHWANHNFEQKRRSEQNAIPGFNMIVLDVDGGIPLHTAQDLMKDYTFMTYTTKRHCPEQNRFRLLIPTNYVLKLDTEDYKAFMNNVMAWLPFTSDESANQRSKKWETFDKGEFFLNPNPDAKTLDVLPFLPRTTKNDQHMKTMEGLQSLDNLERWFAQNIGSGNRNNQLIKYALALVDAGLGYTQVEEAVISFNSRLPNGLSEDELRSTILITVAKKIHGKPS